MLHFVRAMAISPIITAINLRQQLTLNLVLSINMNIESRTTTPMAGRADFIRLFRPGVIIVSTILISRELPKLF
jgi:hypothetical protein